MRRCPKCERSIAADVQTCPHCAAPIEPRPTAITTTSPAAIESASAADQVPNLRPKSRHRLMDKYLLVAICSILLMILSSLVLISTFPLDKLFGSSASSIRTGAIGMMHLGALGLCASLVARKGMNYTPKADRQILFAIVATLVIFSCVASSLVVAFHIFFVAICMSSTKS